jgi:hypothetical protein
LHKRIANDFNKATLFCNVRELTNSHLPFPCKDVRLCNIPSVEIETVRTMMLSDPKASAINSLAALDLFVLLEFGWFRQGEIAARGLLDMVNAPQ